MLFGLQVKQLMEEAVTKKFIHADSSSITSLCGKKYYSVFQDCLLFLSWFLRLIWTRWKIFGSCVFDWVFLSNICIAVKHIIFANFTLVKKQGSLARTMFSYFWKLPSLLFLFPFRGSRFILTVILKSSVPNARKWQNSARLSVARVRLPDSTPYMC